MMGRQDYGGGLLQVRGSSPHYSVCHIILLPRVSGRVPLATKELWRGQDDGLTGLWRGSASGTRLKSPLFCQWHYSDTARVGSRTACNEGIMEKTGLWGTGLWGACIRSAIILSAPDIRHPRRRVTGGTAGFFCWGAGGEGYASFLPATLLRGGVGPISSHHSP